MRNTIVSADCSTAKAGLLTWRPRSKCSRHFYRGLTPGSRSSHLSRPTIWRNYLQNVRQPLSYHQYDVRSYRHTWLPCELPRRSPAVFPSHAYEGGKRVLVHLDWQHKHNATVPSTGQGPTTHTSQPPAVLQSVLAHSQQTNVPPSITVASPSMTPPGSRPASPSTTSGDQTITPLVPQTTTAANTPTGLPVTYNKPTRLRRLRDTAQGFAVWVAIAFTIASFVRDYLDLTKDGASSTQGEWKLRMTFRASCERDLSQGRQSDACDLELSKSTVPPPGLYKRAQPEEVPWSAYELGEHAIQWALTIAVLALVIIVSTIRKCFNRRHDGQCSPASKPDQHEPGTGTLPTDPRHLNSDYTRLRASRVALTVVSVGSTVIVPKVLSLVADLPSVAEILLTAAIVLASTLFFSIVLLYTTSPRPKDIIAAALFTYVLFAAPVSIQEMSVCNNS
jgi:hypothetical protein